MEASSPGNNLPPGVSANDLYDGPKVVPLSSGKATFLAPDAELVLDGAQAPTTAASLVTPIPPPPTTPNFPSVGPTSGVAGVPHPAAEVPVSPAASEAEYVRVVTLALDVLSARLLGFIALVAAVVIWGAVIWDPLPPRIGAAAVFSLLVFAPIMVIYWRAGLAGEGS